MSEKGRYTEAAADAERIVKMLGRPRVRHPAYLAEQERLNKLSARALDVIKTAPRKP